MMSKQIQHDIIVITGPTATGKTGIATKLAAELNGEIISADSRQVYQKMDIGTGKDLDEYIVEGKEIKHHLIDIVKPGYKYNVFEFQRDFLLAFDEIKKKGKNPILCGGTGLYIESAIGRYNLLEVPENKILRKKLHKKSMDELAEILAGMTKLHNTTDTTNKKRLIRAIEIETYYRENSCSKKSLPKLNYVIFATNLPRSIIRDRITKRLKYRLENGMIEEVKTLLEEGLSPESLLYYGLEYKFITQYLTGVIKYDEMFKLLNTAIHQFAKRQMTWFRRMERKGFKINWIENYDDIKAYNYLKL